jgi:hypothetical protein
MPRRRAAVWLAGDSQDNSRWLLGGLLHHG